MQIAIELYIMGMAGVFVHYLKEWVLANKSGKEYNLYRALPMALLSIVTTLIAVYLRDDIAALYPITAFSALALGYFGNSVFFSFLDTKKPKELPE